MTNRTLIGDFGGGDYRMRRSKPGYDVTAALDPERLAFDSAWLDTAQVYAKGSIFVPKNTGIAPIPVNIIFGETLPTVPFCIYWWKVGGSDIRMGTDKSTNAGVYYPYFNSVTTTFIRFFSDASFNPTDYVAGYVILRSIA